MPGRVRVGILAPILLFAWTSVVAGQREGSDATLDALMTRIASTAGTSVRYREEKVLSFLEYALVSYGTLRFEQPDRLIREVDGSTSTRYVVSASSLVIEEEGKDPKQIRLDDYPALRTLMETMRAVFGGDLPVLKRLYRVRLETDGNGWTLDLDPRENDVSRFVTEIKVSGQGGRIRVIETIETGGDRVLMTLLQNG